MQENCLPVSDQVLYKERCKAIKKISVLYYLCSKNKDASAVELMCS